MTGNPGRWSVVTTTAEHPEVLLPFVAHHLAMGADRIYLYLDQPNPLAVEALRHIPRCNITLCDDAYWASTTGTRPNGLENRQITNAQQAYRRCPSQWLAHIDTDEFIAPHRSLADELAHLPQDFDVLTLPVRERVFLQRQQDPTIFSGAFRIPFEGRTRSGLLLLGDGFPYTTGGLTGHAVGKSFVRTGLAHLLMGIHMPRPLAEVDGARRPRVAHARSTTLLHFDGLTPDHWIAKMLRYCDHWKPLQRVHPSKTRNRLLRHIALNRDDPPALRAFHDLLKSVSDSEETRLRALGLIDDGGIDPVRSLQSLNLGLDLEFSCTGFDQRFASGQTPQDRHPAPRALTDLALRRMG